MPLSFFCIRCLHAIALRMSNRNSKGKLLKIDEADEILNVTENKANSIRDIFFLKC